MLVLPNCYLRALWQLNFPWPSLYRGSLTMVDYFFPQKPLRFSHRLCSNAQSVFATFDDDCFRIFSSKWLCHCRPSHDWFFGKCGQFLCGYGFPSRLRSFHSHVSECRLLSSRNFDRDDYPKREPLLHCQLSQLGWGNCPLMHHRYSSDGLAIFWAFCSQVAPTKSHFCRTPVAAPSFPCFSH